MDLPDNLTNINFESIRLMGDAYIKFMFPPLQASFEEISQNATMFLENFIEYLAKAQVLQKELNKFLVADVQAAFQTAIAGASRASCKDKHRVVSQLIVDRIKKPKNAMTDDITTELVINQAIETVSKLDANLIKILSFKFMVTKTKYNLLADEKFLMSKLAEACDIFGDIQASALKFEYLASIGCGLILGGGIEWLHWITASYPQFFLKHIEKQRLEQLVLGNMILDAGFIQATDGYQMVTNA